MAKMIPFLDEEQLDALDSRAEAVVYRACRDLLDHQIVVFHSAQWIMRQGGNDAFDGEADFIVCNPSGGILVIEVKGGGVAIDPVSGDWHSHDRFGVSHSIKDPIRQAKRNKYSILQKLREHHNWSSLGIERIAAGHAVLFPDLRSVQALVTAERPLEIMGGASDVTSLGDWVRKVNAFWTQDAERTAALGPRGVALVEDVFARRAEVAPLLSRTLAISEAKRIRLTRQQAKILDTLAGRRRAAICGGAGTGKSLLAVEKAQRLAKEGFRTLLVCYNRPLAEHLEKTSRGIAGLSVLTFHQLCHIFTLQANEISGRDLLAEAESAYPRFDRFDVHMPLALAYATEISKDRYDAIVVDEGQDFREEFWLPVELLLRDATSSPLYVFYDQNQAIYQKSASFPIKEAPYVLTVNCRNTKPIHVEAYRYFQGELTDPPDIQGIDIERVTAPSLQAQAKKIQAIVTSLIARDQVPPTDVAVLIGDARIKGPCYDLLGATSLPRGVSWVSEVHGKMNAVLIDTVNRFKGLEAAVVILWGIDSLTPAADREVLYVGLSRGKSILYIVGEAAACTRISDACPLR